MTGMSLARGSYLVRKTMGIHRGMMLHRPKPSNKDITLRLAWEYGNNAQKMVLESYHPELAKGSATAASTKDGVYEG
jgi:hypothetical protein